jgi:hypothetical protein
LSRTGNKFKGDCLRWKFGFLRGIWNEAYLSKRQQSVIPDLPQETEELSSLLEGAGASVTVNWEFSGHQLTGTEVKAASEWYQEHFKK